MHVIIASLFLSFITFGCGDNSGTQKEGKDSSVKIKNDANANDKTNQLVMYYFYGRGCRSCREIEYDIDQLPEKYKDKDFVLKKLEVWHDDKNRTMLIRMAKERGKRKGQLGTPITIIGKDIYVGNKLDKIYSLIKKNLKS